MNEIAFFHEEDAERALLDCCVALAANIQGATVNDETS